MSLQTQFSPEPIQANDNLPPKGGLTGASGNRSVRSSVHTQVIKAAVSLALLAGVVILVGYYYGLSEITDDFRAISIVSLGAIFAALLANAFAAVFRFKVIASEINHPIGIRPAMAAVAAGSLAGALFFQITGQLMARGVIAGRGGMPFAAVVVITAYERITAAIISALFALGGAFFIFGNVYIDKSSGGADLIKIIGGLVAATSAGALLGYGRMAVRTITPLLTRHFVRRCLAVIGLTLLVHIPMQAAYVIAAHNLSPQTSVNDLIAASAVVMFATSVPISLAGWGMREMSAVAGLGAIGVSGHAALTTAVIVGLGSLLVVGMIAAVSLPGAYAKKYISNTKPSKSVDYYRVLAWVLPLGAATLVLFQIHVPIPSGLINANLADPIALLGGVLFVLGAARNRQLPRWRVSNVNLAIVVGTLVLVGSLLLGASRFGWTTWAVTNRFLGWFVILGYGATGALIVGEGRKEGFRLLILTFVGAAAAIAGIETALIALKSVGFQLSISVGSVEGFAQNRNAFAFQLLMAMSAAIVLARGQKLRIALLAVIISGFWFAGSRSGWIAGVFVIVASLYLGVLTGREITWAIIGASIAAIVPILLSMIIPNHAIPNFMPESASTQERWLTIVGGMELFLSHPVFGAGLGAFRNEMILSSEGIPLVIHSTPVWLLAEMGIVGFAVFAIAAVFVFLSEWRHARRDQAAALIVLCFVAFAVMGGPGDIFYQRTFWLLTGAGLALQQAGKIGVDKRHSEAINPLVVKTASV
jgi:lysylphosphatidylglycerol synthase-like protein/O-antigen ligase/polysaccharide polymerase Wzy-like membrane protein